MSVSIQVDETTPLIPSDHTEWCRRCIGIIIGVILVIAAADLYVGWLFMLQWGSIGIIMWLAPIAALMIFLMSYFLYYCWVKHCAG